MHKNFVETTRQVIDWASENPHIQGVVIIGSQARREQSADQWSDLDLMVLVDDPRRLMEENTWFNRFGSPAVFFDEIVPLQFNGWSWQVKRVLYADDRDVDFSILPYAHIDDVLAVNKDILSKGYRVIYEANVGVMETKICALLRGAGQQAAHPPSQQELEGVVNDLLFHVIWSLKKILRGELWTAVNCINCYMKGRLLQLIEAHNASSPHPPDVLGYSGRFLEQRTDEAVLARLAGCFTRYDPAEAAETLQRLIDLTRLLTAETCARNSYRFEAVPFERVQKMYDTMRKTGESAPA